MSWIDTLKGALGLGVEGAAPGDLAVQSTQVAPIFSPIDSIERTSPGWGFLFGPAGIDGLPVVSEYSAQQISAVFACVNLIAGAISALPLNLYRRSPDGERTQLHHDDMWWLLNEEMLPRWAATNGWEFIILGLLFHGNGYAIIHRGPLGRIVGLEPIHPLRVQPIPTPDRRELVYVVARDARIPDSVPGTDVYAQADMLHVAGLGFDGYRGLSPLRYHLNISGGVALAAQEFAGRYFTNGGLPSGVLTTDQQINAEKAEELRVAWAERYAGVTNAHNVAVLGNGAKFQAISLSAEDAQLLATRRFQVEEICRIYGVPPFMVGHLEKTTSWGSGVETMGQGFVRFTLRQHLNKIEMELNRKFFRQKAKFCKFDTFDLEKADMQTLFGSFALALGQGGGKPFMSTDEVRSQLNLKRTPGGDALGGKPDAAAANQSDPLEPDADDANEPTTEPAGA